MTDDTFHDDMTLADARDLLRQLVTDGHRCPCCTQLAKVYRRKVNSGMARALLTMYRTGGTSSWVHVTDIDGGRHGGEIGKLRYWNLIEAMPARRDDGGHAGYWRVTARGQDWLAGRTTIPKYALLYDGKLLRLDDTQHATISDALGTPFHLGDLMASRTDDAGQDALPV